MLSQLIQQQVPLGGKVKFILTSGREISGILTEIGRDHVAIETETGISKLPIERIDFWEVPSGDEQELKSVTPSNSYVSEISIEQKQGLKDEALENLEITEINSLDFNQEDSNIDVKDTFVPTTTTSPSNDFNPEIFRRLVEIEARFDANIKASKIDLIPPSFEFPKEELRVIDSKRLIKYG